MVAKLIRWFLFGVVFSALPFAFAAVRFYGHKGHPPFFWYYLWPRGELLLISAGFAADAIGDAASLSERRPSMRIIKYVLIAICVAVVGLASYGYSQLSSAGDDYDPKMITGGSLALFLLTFLNAAFCKVLAEVK